MLTIALCVFIASDRLGGLFHSPPDLIELEGVDVERLAEQGITLRQPTAGDIATAVPVAGTMPGGPGSMIKQTALARLSDEGRVPPFDDRLVWVVSADTTGRIDYGGPVGGDRGPRRIAWSLMFVDAQTGAPLGTIESGAP